MLYSKSGAASPRVSAPYNEKLYATDLDTLARRDGALLPHADIADIIGNMKPVRATVATSDVQYPQGGDRILKASSRCRRLRLARRGRVGIDRDAHAVTTSKRRVSTEASSARRRYRHCPQVRDRATGFTSNRCSLQPRFDRKVRARALDVLPGPRASFYRVGFYDNISTPMDVALRRDRLSQTTIRHRGDPRARPGGSRARAHRRRHQLVAHHDVVLDPAYVHITKQSLAATAQHKAALAAQDIHSAVAMEAGVLLDRGQLVETRALASELTRVR